MAASAKQGSKSSGRLRERGASRSARQRACALPTPVVPAGCAMIHEAAATDSSDDNDDDGGDGDDDGGDGRRRWGPRLGLRPCPRSGPLSPGGFCSPNVPTF